MIKVLDNVLPKNSFNFLHSFFINEPIWKLNMTSQEGHYNIPGRVLWDKNDNNNNQTSSQVLSAFVYQFIKEKSKFLSDDIIRIHIGAKAPMQDDALHKDSIENNHYTVLYYLNPIWKKEWGGETIVGDKSIEYKPNRAVIYKSNILHGGKSPKVPILRTYLNYVVNSEIIK